MKDKYSVLALILVVGFAFGGLVYNKAYKKISPADCGPDAVCPENKIVKLLIVTQKNCVWCDKLKKDWPDGFPIAYEYVDNSQEIANKYKIEGVPTLLAFDKDGNVLKKLVGYLSKPELLEWMEVDVCGGECCKK